MRVIFAGYLDSPIIEELRKLGHTVFPTQERFTLEFAKDYDFLISVGYRVILSSEILAHFGERNLNGHISFLPWGRGADPVLWSVAEGTPLGYSIHRMSRLVDQGEILIRQAIPPVDGESLHDRYHRVRSALEARLVQELDDLLHLRFSAWKQNGAGTHHRLAERLSFEGVFGSNAWSTSATAVEEWGRESKRRVRIDRFGVTLVGTGMIAGGYDVSTPIEQVMTHVRAIQQHPCFEVRAIVNPDRQAANRFCQDWGLSVPIFDRLDDVEAKRDSEVIVIASPNSTHADLLSRALARESLPRAVLCEKPIALRSEGMAALLEKASKVQVPVFVNYLRRWDSKVSRILERAQGGEWGRPQSARVVYSKGVIHNASHAINLLQALFPGSLHVERAELSPWGAEGDAAGSFELRGENDESLVFTYRDEARYSTFEIDVFFEHGRVVFADTAGEIQIYTAEPSKFQSGARALVRSERARSSLSWAMSQVYENLYGCLLGAESPVMPAAEAVQTLELCERIIEKGSYT